MAITCDYCGADPGTKPNSVVWRGFRDQDTGHYVCNDCKKAHYTQKWKGEHKGKYSEFPVLAHY